MVRNENDEAMIVTQQSRIGNPGCLAKNSAYSAAAASKHRRGINIQSVLEDISSSRYTSSNAKKVESRNQT